MLVNKFELTAHGHNRSLTFHLNQPDLSLDKVKVPTMSTFLAIHAHEFFSTAIHCMNSAANLQATNMGKILEYQP